MALFDLINDRHKVSIIGLAKNTGKTVVLNVILEELFIHNVITGITSIGHDGEKYDQINNLIMKPSINVKKDMLVATTDKLLTLSSVKYEILHETDYVTPLGRVLIVTITESGRIEVAGPSTACGVNHVAEQMLSLGAAKVLIDGSMDRKAISAPDYNDGIIVSTGAILDMDLTKVIRETINVLNTITLPKIDAIPFDCLASSETNFFDSNANCVAHINGPLLQNGSVLKELLKDKEVKLISTKRSVTETILDMLLDILRIKNERIVLLINNHTKLFLGKKPISYYQKRGVDLHVVKPAQLLGLTVNPVSPLSHSFESDILTNALRSSLPDIPVFDVLSPKYC